MNTRSAITGIMLASVLLLPVTAETAPIKILPTEDNLRFFAKHDDNLDTVQQLLAEGVDPNGVDWHGRAAVHVAAEHDAAKNMEALLQAGGNPNLQDQDGNTPLHHAARGTIASFDSLTVILLRAGADPNRPNNGGRDPPARRGRPAWCHTEVEALLARRGVGNRSHRRRADAAATLRPGRLEQRLRHRSAAGRGRQPGRERPRG